MKTLLANLIMFLCLTGSAISQMVLIDKTASDFVLREEIMTDKGKDCFTINCIGISDSFSVVHAGVKPLLFIKVFDYVRTSLGKGQTGPLMTLTDYMEKNVLPVLKADMLLKVATLGSSSHHINADVFDSLLVYDGKQYELFTGVAEIHFFNLMDFEQVTPLQANLSIINTLAVVTPVKAGSVMPSIVSAQRDPFPKMYLIKKGDNLFTYRYFAPHDEDNVFSFFRDFVYKKGTGIVGFYSKYLGRVRNSPVREKYYSSSEYYFFKEAK